VLGIELAVFQTASSLLGIKLAVFDRGIKKTCLPPKGSCVALCSYFCEMQYEGELATNANALIANSSDVSM